METNGTRSKMFVAIENSRLSCTNRANICFSFLTKLAVQKYEEMFPAFSDSRECKLLKVCFYL